MAANVDPKTLSEHIVVEQKIFHVHFYYSTYLLRYSQGLDLMLKIIICVQRNNNDLHN